MANTRQVVMWSLERGCKFRTGENWYLPGETTTQLAILRTVAKAAPNKIFDGICVTGFSLDDIKFDGTGKLVFDESKSVPCSGFKIIDRLATFGGLANALLVCGSCEANAKTDLTLQVAGCHGGLDVDPDSEAMESHLQKLIDAHGLRERLRSVFDTTTPLWYGFWIETPLSRRQAELLFELLSILPNNAGLNEIGLPHFLNALNVSIRLQLPLHVRLSPLGHTDMGWHSVFPHCPRCHADAAVKHWEQQYPTEPHQCRACGHIYNLNDTHSSVPDEAPEDDALATLLGQSRHVEFARKYLQYRGCSPDEALAILRRHFFRRTKAD